MRTGASLRDVVARRPFDEREPVHFKEAEVGRKALDKGKQVAGTAVDTLKEEAQNAGLTPGGIAEKVREAGRHAKEVVKEEVKSQGLTGESTSGTGSTSNLGTSTGAGAGITSGGLTTPSATTGTTGLTGTTGTTGSRGNTPRETITPVEQPELSNKR